MISPGVLYTRPEDDQVLSNPSFCTSPDRKIHSSILNKAVSHDLDGFLG
jgi:hypothetical protein